MLRDELLGQLACPAPHCRGALRELDAEITCERCGRGYPIRDGVPHLIREEAGGPSAPPDRPHA